MTLKAGVLAAAILALCPVATPGSTVQAAQDTSEYLERSERWLERNGLASGEAGAVEIDMQLVVERGFARCELGLFDLRLPVAALADEDWLAELREVARSLLEAQMRWTDWLRLDGQSGKSASELARHAKTLDAWIRGWKSKKLGDPEALRGVDLLEATAAKARVREASAGLAAYMRAGGPLMRREVVPEPPRLVLLPEREDFVEFTSLVGMLVKHYRPYFWVRASDKWTFIEYEGTRVIALEYATPRAQDHYTSSYPMNAKNPAGISAHVVQIAMRSLLDCLFGERMEASLAAGLASNLVIAVFDEVDTRTDGDTRSRTTEARSVFVPGGQSSGGVLPANDASSRWRATKGRDYFVGVLQQAQEEAGKGRRKKWEKLTGFVLLDDDERQKHLVRAPFLGQAAVAPPEAFLGDFAEFLRAYRSAFLYWLEQKAEKRSSDSRQKFGELLHEMATSELALDEQFLAVYGVPLSAGGAEALLEQECLEGRFLLWLSK
jgi:hypothetical protein